MERKEKRTQDAQRKKSSQTPLIQTDKTEGGGKEEGHTLIRKKDRNRGKKWKNASRNSGIELREENKLGSKQEITCVKSDLIRGGLGHTFTKTVCCDAGSGLSVCI